MKGLNEIEKKMGKTISALLKKQCKIINVDFNKINFKKHDWYSKYTWTKEQETKFKKFFINYLYKKVKRARESATVPILVCNSKKRLEELWRWWNLMYGWKRSDWECEND